jgi:hypothetical protein
MMIKPQNCRSYSDILSSRFYSTHILFVPLHTGLLGTWEFQIISIMNLKVQDVTAEPLARAQRMNRKIGTFLKCWTKWLPIINFLTHGNIFNIDESGI